MQWYFVRLCCILYHVQFARRLFLFRINRTHHHVVLAPPLPSSPHSCPHYLHPVHQCPRSPPRSISLFFIGIYWQIFLLAPKAIPRLWPGSIVDTQFLLSAINHVFCLKSIACGRSTWQSSYWESRRLCRHAPLGDECVCVVYLYAITVCVMSICTCACVCAMSVCVCVCAVMK